MRITDLMHKMHQSSVGTTGLQLLGACPLIEPDMAVSWRDAQGLIHLLS